MPSGASWKGYLKLSLVTCPVALYPTASGRERVSFHMLNKATGHRLRMRMVDAETGEVVERDDQVKGYEFEKGKYVTVEREELADLGLESSHTIDIDLFAPRAEVDRVYEGDSHYMVPDDKVAEEAFAVIREAMRASAVVGISRVVMNERERYVLLEPRGKGILATRLLYPYEVRADSAAFERIGDAKPDGKMLEAALEIVDAKTEAFEPERFRDHYQEGLKKMLTAKREGRAPPKAAAAPQAPNVVGLFDALRQSIAAEKAGQARRPAARRPAGRKRAAG
jgi:DNA end-binding protein Ku